ncbi:MAG: hypothetical protein B7Y81_05100 [Caulobacter sp. 32-67-35]|nr:MAG: hypothetical protein B7Y81_05100 [Caulobacter sp. 32-67-35]
MRGLREGLVSFSLPIPIPEFAVSLLWHPRMETDPAHRWLRGCVREAWSDWKACRAFGFAPRDRPFPPRPGMELMLFFSSEREVVKNLVDVARCLQGRQCPARPPNFGRCG